MTEPRVTPDDLRQAQDTLAGHVEATDEQVWGVLAAHPALYFKAQTWGWNDTEVRDELCAGVERAIAGEQPRQELDT